MINQTCMKFWDHVLSQKQKSKNISSKTMELFQYYQHVHHQINRNNYRILSIWFPIPNEYFGQTKKINMDFLPIWLILMIFSWFQWTLSIFFDQDGFLSRNSQNHSKFCQSWSNETHNLTKMKFACLQIWK